MLGAIREFSPLFNGFSPALELASWSGQARLAASGQLEIFFPPPHSFADALFAPLFMAHSPKSGSRVADACEWHVQQAVKSRRAGRAEFFAG